MTLLSMACVSPYSLIETMSVCRTVYEIFSVKEWRDLKTGGRGRSRSLKMVPFDRPYTTFYWSAIVSLTVCCTVGILLSRLVWENWNGGATRWWKKFEDMYNCLDTIPACDRRTDILPRHSPRYAYASRGKNEFTFWLIFGLSSNLELSETLSERQIQKVKWRSVSTADVQ